MDETFSPTFFGDIIIEEPDHEIAAGFNPLLVYPTPPDSVSSVNTPSPCTVTTSGVLLEGIPNYTPMNVSSPGLPSSAAVLVPCPYQPSDTAGNRNYPLSASLPVGGAEHARRPTRRPQLTSAQCGEASIKILNPRLEYDKIQKKHGPRGKFSEQRIQNGQGQVRVKCESEKSTPFSLFLYEPNNFPRVSHFPALLSRSRERPNFDMLLRGNIQRELPLL